MGPHALFCSSYSSYSVSYILFYYLDLDWIITMITIITCGFFFVKLGRTEYCVRELECTIGERRDRCANGYAVVELDGEDVVQKPCHFLRCPRHLHPSSA